MSAPESPTSADQALSSLMGVIIDSPEYARLVSAPRDWKAVQAAIDDYLEGYELRLDEGCHTPTEFERFLLVDAVAGLMHDDEFIDALYSVVTAARPAPAAGDALDVNALMAAEYQQWIDWYHQGRDYHSFLKERLNAAIAAQQGERNS
ncbi:hypothetical protein [Achromobacter insolitus]|uniref:hypothetical protein n=1 Tax=Achromobacter insolitus TaxID=217204 RepID=UPI00241C596A|nr:hypothetical protein [Achromobacter insolitus]